MSDNRRRNGNRNMKMQRVGSERVIRQAPRRELNYGRLIIWIILPWLLVLINVFLLFQLRRQVESLSDSMGLILKRLLVLEEQQDQGYQNQEYQNQEYYGASSENVVSGTIISDYGQTWGLDKVERPKERTRREILERLRALGADSELIKKVADNSSAYPDQLLEALANNPELKDFAANYLEKKGTAEGGLTESEKEMEYPLFLQWDPRWGYASYGDDSVVGLSGCGPTALSMVLYYLTRDETLTPDKLAEYSMKNGYYISGTGTAWLLLENVPPHYGVSVNQPDASQWVMEQALDKEQVIICSMGPGDFTIGGHFVVIYGYDEEGFLLNDPNCVARSREHWTWEQLKDQIKHIWIFGKGSSNQGGLNGIGGIMDAKSANNYQDINVWTESNSEQ